MIPYECDQCGTIKRVRNGSTNESVRTLSACETCEEVTNHENVADDIGGKISVVEREYLRQEYPEVLVTTKSSTTKTFHIPDASGNKCYRLVETRKVNVDTYPLGYPKWCNSCIQEITK